MPIKKITIENTRGFKKYSIENEILKNRPNILVAPNGFGKSSIATAFKNAANQTLIKICEEDRHQHNLNTKARLSLELEEDGIISALNATEDAYSNEIRKHFDIHVVSDLRKIKAHSKNMGKFSVPQARMIVGPITICNKSNRVSNPYKISEIRRACIIQRALLSNLNNDLFQSKEFIMRSPELVKYLDSLIKPRKRKEIESIKQVISNFRGDFNRALENAASNIDQLCNNIQDAKEAIDIIIQTTKLEKGEAFLALWQLLFVMKDNGKLLKNYLEYLRYSAIKKSLQSYLNDLNTSWKTPTLKETKGKLVVDFPDPAHISNGQRDLLLLLSMLHIARHSLTKKRAIVIIDEVFDYLDDANLTVAQYFISQLIQDYKLQGRSIYPIILTHLNPNFFRNYTFSKQNVIYLDNGPAFDSIPALKKLIAARSHAEYDDALLEQISKYLVHYHIDEYEFSSDLQEIPGVRSSWGKVGKFQEFLKGEFKKYESGQKFDPLAICAITRRSIEELAYRQISHCDDALEFFRTHKTGPKLDWASQREASIPESHYLLKLIFDDGLHWRLGRDNTIPIVAKLANPVIKKMITDVVNQCLEEI